MSGLILPSGLWSLQSGYRLIRTEHFTIHFTEEERETARAVADFAEEAYGEVSRRLGHFPAEIPVVLPGDTDRTNGAFIPAPDRIVLYPAPSSPFRLRTLFIHELTHYIHLNAPSGIFGFLGRFLGEGARAVNSALIPGWMAEGITIRLETELTGGGRGRDPFFEAAVKGFIYDGALWEAWQSSYAVETYPVDRIYLAGYFMVRRLLQVYGDDVVPPERAFSELYRLFTGRAFFSPNRALKLLTGSSLEQFFDELETALAREWADDFLIPPGETLPGIPSGEGIHSIMSASSRELLYYREEAGRPPAVFSLPLPAGPASGGSEPVLEVRLSTPGAAAAASDGTIYFAADGFEAGAVRTGLYRLDPGAARPVRISDRGGWIEPAVSPDGSRLYAVRSQGRGNALVELPLSGGAEQQLLVFTEEGRISGPEVSPGGSMIAFSGSRSEGEQDIFIFQPNGQLFRLAAPGSGECRPAWSGDGSLLFVSDAGGSTALYRIGAEQLASLQNGSPAAAARILRDPVGIESAVEIPESGGSLAYTTFRSSGRVIRTAEPAEEPEAVLAYTPEPVPIKGQSSPSRPASPIQANAEPLDIPVPSIHTLLPFFAVSGSADSVEPLLGATLFGGDPTGRTALTFFAGALPGTAQAEYALFAAAEERTGSLRFDISSERSYLPAAGELPAEREWTSAFTVSWLPFRYCGPQNCGSILLRLSAAHSSLLSSAEDFSLEEETAMTVQAVQELRFSAGTAFAAERRPTAPLAYYGGDSLDIGASWLTAPALLDREEPVSLLLLCLDKGILPFRNKPWRLLLESDLLITDYGSTDAFLSYNVERWNDPLARLHGGRALFSAALQVPLAIFEKRVLGVPVTRLGFSCFGRTGATFAGPGEDGFPFSGHAAADSVLLLGGEISTRIMVSRIPLPLALRVQALFDYGDMSSPRSFAFSIVLGDQGAGTY